MKQTMIPSKRDDLLGSVTGSNRLPLMGIPKGRCFYLLERYISQIDIPRQVLTRPMYLKVPLVTQAAKSIILTHGPPGRSVAEAF
jgi:hypothetical protein